MKSDRGAKPRGKSPKGSAAARRPRRADEPTAFRESSRPPARRDFGVASDPYRSAKRPARGPGAGAADKTRAPSRPYAGASPRAAFGSRPPGRGFTVTLDPDVARVFRGDAAVNRALRLVLQLMQVVQGPPRPAERAQRGYQGSPQARGFTRRPRFEEDGEPPAQTEE